MINRYISVLFAILLALASYGQQMPDLRVMSFNIERGDLGRKQNRGWEQRKDACLKMLQTRKPALLGLQECNSTQRDDIKACLEGYGHIGLSVDGDSAFHKVSSNPIYYDKETVQLQDWGTIWFADDPYSPGADTWTAKKPRNATWGEFLHKRTGRRFFYLNMHIQNGIDAVQNRSLSLLLVIRKLMEVNPEGHPVICTGDLNSNAVESYYAPFKQIFDLAALSCDISDKGDTYNGYTGKSKAGRIDHVFYAGFNGLEFVIDRDEYEGVKYISDHYPVYADLTFAPESSIWSDKAWVNQEADKDAALNIGTYNIPKHVRDNPQALISFLNENEVAVLGVQGIDMDSEKLLSKSLKKQTKGRYVLLISYSDPSKASQSKAVGIIYDKFKVKMELLYPFWLRDDYESPGVTWDESTCWGGLSAIMADKASGARFFVISTQLPDDKGSRKLSPAPLKKVDRNYNPDRLPSFLLADFNGTNNEMNYMSLLNYWVDTYTIQRAERDKAVATSNADDPYDWNNKMDMVCLTHFVDNNTVVLSNTVLRSENDSPVHYPVISSVVVK